MTGFFSSRGLACLACEEKGSVPLPVRQDVHVRLFRCCPSHCTRQRCRQSGAQSARLLSWKASANLIGCVRRMAFSASSRDWRPMMATDTVLPLLPYACRQCSGTGLCRLGTGTGGLVALSRSDAMWKFSRSLHRGSLPRTAPESLPCSWK